MGGADVLCLGETMALFVPAEPGPAEDVRTWTRAVGGAESNVACHLADLGVRATWVSAVGDDPFGRAVVDFVAGHGVDVGGVVVDPDRPTGVYFKTPGGVRYYRRGSAASGMGPELLADLPLAGVDLVHTSGITPALSPSCLALTRALLAAPRSFRVSFDVNRRPALRAAQDPELLRELAALADIVLVGEDEAEALWGAAGPAAIRAVLPEPPVLVVKQAERGATLLAGDRPPVFQPALRVEVVEPVGAGDAFAAGYLAALLAGQPPVRRLRAAHLRAASALRTREDVGPPLPAALVASLLEATDEEWRAARIPGHGAGPGADTMSDVKPDTEGAESMARIAIHPEGAAPPSVPLSPGIRKGNIVQVAGQVGVDPATGELAGPTVAGQTRQVLRNIEAVLAAAGATIDDVVMLRVYLTDTAHFPEFNAVYADLVPQPFPARTTVYVGLPAGLLVEIDALAVVG